MPAVLPGIEHEETATGGSGQREINMPICTYKWLVVMPALLAGGASVGGCSSIEGYQRRPEAIQVIANKREAFFGVKAEAVYNATVPEADRRKLRDRIIYGKMEVIEYDFEALERALNSTGNSVGLVGDLSVLTLTGIASTTGGEATKSALAALSSGVVGAQGAVSKNLYFQRTLPALLAQMDANRAKVQATIIASLISKSDAEYPLSAAAIDLRRLIRAGSIPASVTQITEQAAKDKEEADKKLNIVRDVSSSTSPSTKALTDWLIPKGDDVVDRVQMGKFQAWLNRQPDQSVRGTPAGIVAFGNRPDFELIRQRALQDPTLAIPH